MDPEECLRRLLQAIDLRERDAATEAASDLAAWLRNGGYLPFRRDAREAMKRAVD